MNGFRALLRAALLVGSVACSAAPQAQETPAYPTRPIRLLIPGPPGGLSDLLAHLVGDRLAASLGQPVIMEYKPGATGAVAMQTLIASPPDGYTLMLGYAGLTQSLAFRSGNNYSLRSFTPVAQLTLTNLALFVPASLKVDTVAQFVALVKSHPGQYSFGSAGVSSTGHISGEMLSRAAKLEMTHIPYKSEALGLTDMFGNQLQAFFGGSFGTFLPHVKTGKLRLLAVHGTQRSPAAPDVPTWAEAGYPSAGYTGWAGIIAPAQTPKPVVSRLSQEIVRIVGLPEVRAKMEDWGIQPVGSTSEAFTAFIEQDLKNWMDVAKTTGFKLD